MELTMKAPTLRTDRMSGDACLWRARVAVAGMAGVMAGSLRDRVGAVRGGGPVVTGSARARSAVVMKAA